MAHVIFLRPQCPEEIVDTKQSQFTFRMSNCGSCGFSDKRIIIYIFHKRMQNENLETTLDNMGSA